MNIKGFRIKNQKIQKIWIAVLIAIIVAFILIGISFYLVFSEKDNITVEELFEFSSYYTKYNVVTYSNKNQNTYVMEEYCMKDNNDFKFRFNTKNDTANYSYIVTPDSFSIKSETQMNEFKNYNDLEENVNILSLATFIDIYLKANKMIEENNFNSGIKIELEQKDDAVSYNIIFEDKNLSEENELYKYKEILVGGMKISKLELILDNTTKLPIEYVIYLESGNAYVDITYYEFKINPKFDEKVFSF